MILADKIMNLRKKNGWSQEELANQLHVSRQSVSKWESAQSTPDLDKILQMANIFGVSTDYLLKDEMIDEEYVNSTDEFTYDESLLKKVSLEEANKYLVIRQRISVIRSIGVTLCICSPIPLMMFSCYYSRKGAILGLACLVLMVGFAVALFIISGRMEDPYDYLNIDPIDTEYGVNGMVKEKQKSYQSTHTMYLVIGIVLCVISCVPLFIASTMLENNCIGVSLLLLCVGIGVYFIIHTCIIDDTYKALLQEGDFSVNKKKENRILKPYVIIYWILITAIYLAISFINMKWETTWIVWPVAAVFFVAYRQIILMILNTNK